MFILGSGSRSQHNFGSTGSGSATLSRQQVSLLPDGVVGTAWECWPPSCCSSESGRPSGRPGPATAPTAKPTTWYSSTRSSPTSSGRQLKPWFYNTFSKGNLLLSCVLWEFPRNQCFGSGSTWIRNFCLDPNPEILFRIQQKVKEQINKTVNSGLFVL